MTGTLDEKKATYLALLKKWQSSINLVGQTTLRDASKRHWDDSAQILPLLPPLCKTVYDLGSGAGFPGLVLAMSREQTEVTLIESDLKKCAFLRTVSRETETRVKIFDNRLEQAVTHLPAPDIITARAFAPLQKIMFWTEKWWQEKPVTLLLLKGRDWMRELEEAQIDQDMFHVEHFPSVTDPEARILKLTRAHYP